MGIDKGRAVRRVTVNLDQRGADRPSSSLHADRLIG